MFSYNGALCMYYACVITFRMGRKNVVTYAEPLLHAWPITTGLAFAISSVVAKPSKIHNFELFTNLGIASKVWSACNLIIISTSLILVVGRVLSTHRASVFESKVMSSMYGRSTIDTMHTSRKDTRLILMQTMALMSIYSLTILLPFLLFLQGIGNFSQAIVRVLILTVPSQGVFNLLLFLWQKYCCHRQVNAEATFIEILVSIFRHRSKDPIFISRLSLLGRNSELMNPNRGSGECIFVSNSIMEECTDEELADTQTIGDSNGFDTSKWLKGTCRLTSPTSQHLEDELAVVGSCSHFSTPESLPDEPVKEGARKYYFYSECQQNI